MNKTARNDILFPANENGVYKYEYPVINGIKQYVQIRGADKKNPLLLFLHGGPGGSLAGLCHVLQAEWEKLFTVVNWDQRNACKTYLANKDKAREIAKTGSMEDHLNDISEIIAYLHTIYDFDKLILVGFSWGSIIGAEYAKKHPEDILCYIGVGQFVNFRDGIELISEELSGLISESNTTDLKKLAAIKAAMPNESKMTKELFIGLRDFSMLGIKYIAKHAKPLPLSAILHSPFLKFKERLAMLNGDFTLQDKTYSTMIAYDFRGNMRFEIPVMFLFGEEDISCPLKLLQSCFDDISAPKKKLSVIKEASHCCFNDKPDDFFTELREFLQQALSSLPK